MEELEGLRLGTRVFGVLYANKTLAHKKQKLFVECLDSHQTMPNAMKEQQTTKVMDQSGLD